MRQNLAGSNFTIPPTRGSNIHVMGEIISAKNFSGDNLYIFYEIRLPEHWQFNTQDYYDPRATETDESDLVNRRRSTTQNSRAVPYGPDRKPISHFSFPLAYNFLVDEEGMNRRWPIISLQVNSCDDWGRHRIEGYGFLELPNQSGFHQLSIHTWRPVESLYAEIHSFYLGGSVRVENPWELTETFSYDEQGEKSVINRYGLHTESSGSVQFQLSVAIQTHDEMERQQRLAQDLQLKQKNELAWRQREKKAKLVLDRTSAKLGYNLPI